MQYCKAFAGARTTIKKQLKHFIIMSTLKDLCTNIPVEILQAQKQYKAQKHFQKRVQALGKETDIFERCKQVRPNRTKYRNTLYREQAGTMGNYVHTVRVGEYITNVCSSKRTF